MFTVGITGGIATGKSTATDFFAKKGIDIIDADEISRNLQKKGQAGYEAIVEKYGTPDVIVGVATGAIAQGALVAEELGVPFAYVRSSAKEHGLGNIIEGKVESGQRVVVIEDLISTGGSSLKAVAALKESGATVLGMAAIFTYNFQLSYNNFKEAGCELITLSDYDALVQQAVESKYITESDVSLIRNWRLDPSSWTGN